MLSDEKFKVLESQDDLIRRRKDNVEWVTIEELKSDGTTEVTIRLKADYEVEKALCGNIMPNEIADFKDGDRSNYDLNNLYVRPRTPDDPPTNLRVKPVVLYPESLSVCENGRIISKKTNIMLSTRVGCEGYLRTSTHPLKENVVIRNHAATAQAFIDNPENKPQINHIDGIKVNSHVENLEYVTEKENSDHAREMGLIKPLSGEKTSGSSISDEKRLEIAAYSLTHTQREAATAFNVSLAVVKGSVKFKQQRDDYNEGDYLNGVKMI